MEKILMTTFDEAFTKSEEVRKKIINSLLNNLKNKNVYPTKVERLRIFFSPEYKEILLKTFGIKKIYEGFAFKNIEDLKNFLKNFSFEGSFRFTVKRIDKSFPKTSIEVSKELGSFLEELGYKVDLKNPENNFIVEIHKDKVLFFYKVYNGLGGLPVGSQGKTLFLFSGGIDSPVAAFLLAKRGIKPICLFFSNGNPIVEFKTLVVFKILNEFLNSELYFLRINFNQLVKDVKSGYKQITVKYIMYKLAEKVANKFNLYSFGTGEVLSQVSTQTLKSLYLLDKKTDKLVLRPLLGFDKDEIKKLAQKIGTLKYSELIDELCTVEKHSVPWPNEKIFEEELKKVKIPDIELINSKEINDYLINQIKEFEKLKNKAVFYKDSQNSEVVYCKTGSSAWESKKGKFACSEKDLKINFFDLINIVEK